MRFFIKSKDIGIDLGTSNTLLYVKGEGVILEEPSVVAINTTNRQVLAVGADAKDMIGRTPKGIETIRPLKDGVIANFDLTQQMLKNFIEKINGKGVFKSSKIAISHPSGITEVEKKAINEVINQMGVRKIMLVEESVAAAIGSGLPVNEPVGNMIIDIGGGTTEIAVISLQGIVTSKTLRVAGDELDETIIDYVKREFNLIIGERTAEKIKIELGSVYVDEEERNMEIRGIDLATGLPKAVTIIDSEIREVLKESVALIIEAIKATIEQTPPELAADIMDKGIMLSGGGSLLKGLDKLIYSELNIPSYIAENPLQCVVLGAGKSLDM
ncbi:rod shape-determining protein MreB [Clostridium carboxidivorans P7]|uniref:Cell shape-determining protein MreB n=1 Tax=Clostridium carboxidivorans P7 TaxID=536227 RepID=C6Q2J0_9CLOT|nr:rod shape-determining protein [Clostridium carboxidivorans]AKN29802.1 rod shape-determining protein MreB [Clostridium carboxidivorans P7]EET84293.1 cell shape determining protein, MreB/Mrl family [Clostridium carboxidivorans P7]